MVRGVIFDLDGTLGDTLPVCFAAFRRVFEEYTGVLYADDEIRAMFGPTEEGILEAHLPDDGAAPVEAYLAAYTAAHDLAPAPFPGIVEIIDELEAHGVPMAVVTGKGLRSALLSLERWGLRHRFDRIEAGATHGNVKHENMRRVIAGWGVPAADVVSVGDAPSDITAAHAVGAVAVAAGWASTTDGDRIREGRPDHVFDRVADFAAWLRTRLG